MLVTNHCRGIIRLLKGKLELLPGENTVDDELWYSIRENQHVKTMMAQKMLSAAAGGCSKKELPSTPPAQQESASEEDVVIFTADMKAKEAIAKVAECEDAEWLEESLEGETRSTVIDALEKRLDDLEVVD